jgi:glycopeptide antibiotics resistance protein
LRTAAIVAFVLSVMVIIGGSLYPFHYRVPVSEVGPVSLLLLSGTRWPQWGDFLRNIVFYAPTGFLAGLVVPARVPAAQRLTLIAVFASVLSLGNEVLQYYVGRYTSAFDVYANALGAVLGGSTSLLAHGQLGRRKGRRA